MFALRICVTKILHLQPPPCACPLLCTCLLRNYQKWDMEMEGLDDEHDVGGNPVNSDRRIRQLFAAIKDMKTRGDVVNTMAPVNERQNFSVYENEPVPPDVIPMNPDYSYNDLRAISEKRRRWAFPGYSLITSRVIYACAHSWCSQSATHPSLA